MEEATCARFSGEKTVSVIGEGVDNIGLDFAFDHVFTTDATQDQVYSKSAFSLVQSVLEGFNGTIFVYGQTSSGKTFTMQGANVEDVQSKGSYCLT